MNNAEEAISNLDLNSKQAVVDFLFEVQNGNISCRRGASELVRVNKKPLPSFEFHAIILDSKLDQVCIDRLNGLHCITEEEVEIEASLDDYIDNPNDFSKNCVIDFIAKNLQHCEGQISFPETGQWDFPPYWEFDIEVEHITIIPDDEL